MSLSHEMVQIVFQEIYLVMNKVYMLNMDIYKETIKIKSRGKICVHNIFENPELR